MAMDLDHDRAFRGVEIHLKYVGRGLFLGRGGFLFGFLPGEATNMRQAPGKWRRQRLRAIGSFPFSMAQLASRARIT